MIPGKLTQAEFGALVGISQQAVSELVRSGVLAEAGTGAQWLLAYCHRLREQAAGRSDMLSTRRAELALAQRESIEIKNAVLRGQYASIQLLAEVLATASQAVSQRFEHLPGRLKKACPDLPTAAIDEVMANIARARNEWVQATAELVAKAVTAEDDLEAEDEPRAD